MGGSASIPPYASGTADYARSKAPCRGARVAAVREGSPAWEAGIEPGMVVLEVEGKRLTDMIVWLWEADGPTVDLVVSDLRDGAVETCTLEREGGEDWGIRFDDAVFDGMRTCVNACRFCFMTMLPKGLRETLYIRDDDYRLSFLQGNFVTLTNISDGELDDIVEKRLSPMNVSLHAVSPDVREFLIGRNARRGMEVLERLVDEGIEIHAQVVLCPDVNDGVELDRTLRWCEERPQVTSLGIVPLGYTRFQTRFSSSYSDDPAAARAVIERVEPYRARARERCGRSVYQLSDEFYLDAGLPVPPEEDYDGYPQYYDGIGMLRVYLDETDRALADGADLAQAVAETMAARDLGLIVLSGAAAAPTVARFVEAPPLQGRVFAVENRFFGGNVDVTGLICACDVLDQLPCGLAGALVALPSVMFNADGLTLDGMSSSELVARIEERGARTVVCSTMPGDLLASLEEALAEI